MVNRTKIAVIERSGTDLDYQDEGKHDDQIECGGLYSDQVINFEDSETGENTTLNELKEGAQFGVSGRYALVLQHNGTISNNTFIGYDSLINGLDTPIIIPRDSELKDLTFSNSRSSADYTLQLRKNSSTATPFKTISKTNTKHFTEIDIDESFVAGDTIYVKYLDDGTNASDAVIVLFLRND